MSTTAPDLPAAVRRHRRWPRVLGGLLALAVAIVAGLPWLLQTLLMDQLPSRLSQALGRPVALQAVQVGLWQRELTFTGLQIGPGAGQAAAPPLLVLPQLRLQWSLQSLRHRAPVLEALQLDGLRINLARTAPGRYDIDDLLVRFAGGPDAPATEPARFALYNLALADARIRLDDRPAGQVHEISQLALGLPFLSNMPGHLAVRTEPHLAFTLNGTRFDSGASAWPFAQQRQGELQLAFQGLDLAPWLGYLPAGLPIRLQSARVSSDLRLRFALPPHGPPQVSLLGQLQLDQVALDQTSGPASSPGPAASPLLRWQTLSLALDDVQPLARKVKLGALTIKGAEFFLARNARGQLQLPSRAAADAGPAAAPGGQPASGNAPGSAETPWQLSLARLALQDARLHWADASTRPAAALQLTGLTVQGEALHWPAERPMTIQAEAHLRQAGADQADAGVLRLDGQLHSQSAGVDVQVEALSLAALRPYLAGVLQPAVSGTLALKASLDWADGSAAPARLGVVLSEARLSDLQLRTTPAGKGAEAAPSASWQALVLTDARVDLLAHRLSIGKLQLQKPQLALARDGRGQLDIAAWAVVPPPDAGPATPRSAASASRSSPGPAWQLQVKDVSWQDGGLQWADALPAGPLRLRLDQLRGRLQDLSWPPTAAAGTPPPVRLQLAARLARGKAQAAADTGKSAQDSGAGQIEWQGGIGLAPLQADGRLTLRRLPLHLLMPYTGDALPVLLQRADIGFQGQVKARQAATQQWLATVQGDLQVNEVRVQARPPGPAADGPASAIGDDLLSWQSLALAGLQFSLPAQGKPRLEVAQADLRDFYSRLVITEQGRFNLQDVAAPAGGSTATATATATAIAVPAPAPAPASAADGAPPADAGLPIDLVLGGIALHNGRVDFSDRFVRPNYSAKLTDLQGSIGALRSGSRAMAAISLRGRAADTAALDISGQINPTVQPLALDIRARATDLELAPLSPYAGKYAGYAIERGKLSMDIAYKVAEDGKLEASNQVILNQLTFGDRVESPSATQLPVLLAVALLKDRNGVIDLNLPVSGSVSDPQFSIGGIVWKLVLNLIGKALTAPFSLLSGGGTDDLSLLEFVPGSAQLADSAGKNLARVAQALLDRPALTMTVAGVADPAVEREALQRAQLDERLIAQHQLLQLRSAGGPSGAASAARPAAPAASAAADAAQPPVLSDAQRALALTSLYRQATLPDKPRNAVGQLKDLPAAEMQARLLAQTAVTEEAARDLALRRGLAVRDTLAARGLPTDRLFLAAPKLRASGEGDAAWTPRVELKLAPR